MAKPLIMVVDDEIKMANEIADSIKKTNKYDVVVAYSAKEAFKLLEKNKRMFGIADNKIRCILLDVKMPEMDGLQFLKKLRKEYEERIGVIMVTAYEDLEKWDKALDEKISGYITKPFSEEELLKRIDKLFSSDEAEYEMIAETYEKGFYKMEKLGEEEEKGTGKKEI